MKNRTKIWLIIATVLVLVGIITVGGVMTVFKWDISKLSTSRFETNLHKIGEDFGNISINTDTASVTFVLSDDGKCRVECYENTKANHSVTVSDGTLFIDIEDNRAWYDYIMNFGSPKLTVALPKTEYSALTVKGSTGNINVPEPFKFMSADISLSTGNVSFSASASGLIKLKTSTGKIDVENASAGELELSASTGRITVSDAVCQGDVNVKVSTGKTVLTDTTCKNLISSGSTGSVSLNNVMAAENFSIKRSTGSVKLEGSDANEIYIKTSTGSVEGSLLSEKVFITDTSTGKVDVPKTVGGGRCEIKTSTGNIKFEIK